MKFNFYSTTSQRTVHVGKDKKHINQLLSFLSYATIYCLHVYLTVVKQFELKHVETNLNQKILQNILASHQNI